MINANLSHVALRVPDVESGRRFYEDVMGLSVHEIGDGRVRMGWGVGQHALELVEGQSGLDHFAYELPDVDGLDILTQRLKAAGVESTWVQPSGAHPEALVLHDPEGNRIEFHARVDRSGERVADPGRRPVRIQHITVGTCAMSEMVEFYEGVLDLKVSDKMAETFTWLRSNREHHTFALVESDTPGIDHYSYDVVSWDDFKWWCDELAVRGVRIAWGPGRHGPGNNLFIIFPDAAGLRVELSAEMELYWDDRATYMPRLWSRSPDTVNLWGPTPSWRQVATTELTA